MACGYAKELSNEDREQMARALADEIKTWLSQEEATRTFFPHPDTPISVLRAALEILYGKDWTWSPYRGSAETGGIFLQTPPQIYLKEEVKGPK